MIDNRGMGWEVSSTTDLAHRTFKRPCVCVLKPVCVCVLCAVVSAEVERFVSLLTTCLAALPQDATLYGVEVGMLNSIVYTFTRTLFEHDPKMYNK
jgi:hypothetical protein